MDQSLNHSPVVYHLSLLNILASECCYCVKKKKKKSGEGKMLQSIHLIFNQLCYLALLN